MMIDVKSILYEICGDERVFQDDFDLIESELLDSYAFIELFYALEDLGVELQPTQINRDCLRTPGSIQKIIEQQKKNF